MVRIRSGKREKGEPSAKKEKGRSNATIPKPYLPFIAKEPYFLSL